ncbi:NTP pyrophosphohydrolase, partial [Streptomyces pilosus]
MNDTAALLVIVDAANVVGSVPDGWWRDRRGAAERLRDRLAADGVPDRPGPLEIVLVVEGAARGVEPVPGVRVESAPGSGDDHMVGRVGGA